MELLVLAVQRIPDAGRWRLRLAWAEIEVRRYSDALQMLDSVASVPGTESETTMARAVARWRAEEKDKAMKEFEEAFDGAKAVWENSRLIRALYSPMTAQSIVEMNGEVERRRKKAKTD